MHNLLKAFAQKENNIENFKFLTKSFKGFNEEEDIDYESKGDEEKNIITELELLEHGDKKIEKQKKEKKKTKQNELEPIEETAENREKKTNDFAEKMADEILKDAKEKADAILQQAKNDAAQMKIDAEKRGHEEGYEKGYQEGYETAAAEVNNTLEIKSWEYINELKRTVDDIGLQKNEIFNKYKLDLRDMAIAVAEKVIQVSLKSSGEIIERMIISATERLSPKSWVKVYISKTDAEAMIETDRDITKILSNLSENIKVISMENEPQGTCIIELPDEIIDASAYTQLENIRDIISSSSTS